MMKLAVQYLNDRKGNTHAVQLSISVWEKLLTKVKKYEQMLKLKSDLKDAFEEVEKMRTGQKKKQTLSAFLNEI